MKPTQEELTAEVIETIKLVKFGFYKSYEYQEARLLELLGLLEEAESRGILVEEAVQLADTSFWLSCIKTHLKYVELFLEFANDPGPKSLRALIQIRGPCRKRAKAQVEILEEQLQRRLARFANMPPDEAFELLRDHRGRVLANYLHIRSGFGGTELAEFFKVPKGTAYDWLRWFKGLPEGLRESVLKFIDQQGFSVVAGMPPTVASRTAMDDGAT